MKARRLELFAGVLSGVCGLAALGVGLFAPLGTECVDTAVPSSSSSCSPINLVQEQGLASLSLVIALFGALSLGVIILAVVHSLTRATALLILLWVCTALLYFSTLIALLSIGLFFVPADLLALAASIAGTVAPQRSAPLPA